MRTSVSAPAGGIRPFYASVKAPASFAWLLPDLAFLGAAVTLFYSLFLFGGFQAFFHDSDAGWHIRAGEQILRTGVLPRVDSFSFTAAGRPWFAWEWLADLAVGATHQAWGLTGVAFLYGIALAGGVWLWFRLNQAAGGDFLLSAAFAVPMLSTTNLHWLARPHVFGWLFAMLTLWYALELPKLGTQLSIVALVSCLWANVHASFLLGPGILAVFALASLVQPLIFRSADSQATRYAISAVVALAATFVNPYGPALHAHVLSYLSDGALLDRVGEFQSFNFHLAGSTQILLALGVAAIGAVCSLQRKDVAGFLLTAVLLAMALRSARALPLVALLALPIANGAITEALQTARNVTGAMREKLNAALSYSSRLAILDSRASGLVWTPVVLLLAMLALRVPAAGFPAHEFPVAASYAVAALPPNARILASDKFGGYLIYRFAGERKVFFDGRSDLYGAKFLEEYGNMTQLRPGWRDTLNQYHFDAALLPPNAPLIEALQSNGWNRIYSDSVATLLSAPHSALRK